MEFKLGSRSVAFEFLYDKYVISIADYLRMDADEELYPGEKITIMIHLRGQSVSNKTLDWIAKYMTSRMKGNAVAYENSIAIAPTRDDQTMSLLMSAIDVLLV